MRNLKSYANYGWGLGAYAPVYTPLISKPKETIFKRSSSPNFIMPK